MTFREFSVGQEAFLSVVPNLLKNKYFSNEKLNVPQSDQSIEPKNLKQNLDAEMTSLPQITSLSLPVVILITSRLTLNFSGLLSIMMKRAGLICQPTAM